MIREIVREGEKALVKEEEGEKKDMYIALESHPNLGGVWVGKIGTKEEIKEYLRELYKEGNMEYLFCILLLQEKAEMNDIDMEKEFNIVWNGDYYEFKRWKKLNSLEDLKVGMLVRDEEGREGIIESINGEYLNVRFNQALYITTIHYSDIVEYLPEKEEEQEQMAGVVAK